MNPFRYNLILCGLISLLVLSGCGGDNNPTNPNPQPEPEPEPTIGAVEVLTHTSGPDPDDYDEDGYLILVDGGNSQPADTSDSIIINELEEGEYDIELQEVAPTCDVTNKNPQSVTVVADDTSAVSFEISCKEVLKNEIILSSRRTGYHQLHKMNADGTNPEILVNETYAYSIKPAISPDGTRIAYSVLKGYDQPYRLYVVNADGTDLQELDSSDEGIGRPTWSPDGQYLAYGVQLTSDVSSTEIFKINVNGSDKQPLTDNSDRDNDPSWSPDGSTILFSSNRSGYPKIFQMDADGNNVERLTNSGGAIQEYTPSWSPDGEQIAYHQIDGSDKEIYVWEMEAGTSLQLTSSADSDQDPQWSPDGSSIIYWLNTSTGDNIYRVPSDGMGSTEQLSSSGQDYYPFWSPIK